MKSMESHALIDEGANIKNQHLPLDIPRSLSSLYRRDGATWDKFENEGVLLNMVEDTQHTSICPDQALFNLMRWQCQLGGDLPLAQTNAAASKNKIQTILWRIEFAGLMSVQASAYQEVQESDAINATQLMLRQSRLSSQDICS
jgi:hypothetical protein